MPQLRCTICLRPFRRGKRPPAASVSADPRFIGWCVFCAMVAAVGPPPLPEEE
jgi:hypothetical protein